MTQILLSSAQCRMARALLGWTQPELAERCGLAPMTVSKFEKEDFKARPEARTLQKITSVFELSGIEFLEGDGVRKKQQHVKIFQGQQDFWLFFDDVYDVAKNHPNSDICITNVKEAEFDRWLGEFESVHTDRMTKLQGHKLRVLLKENDRHLTSTSYCQYRWTKASQFADAALYMYGDKTAFIEFSENNVIVTLVESPTVTSSIRKMFESVWKDSTEIGA